MTKSKITKADREALKARGFIEGQPNTIPENISPVIKAQLLREMGEDPRDPLDHDGDGRKGGTAVKK